MLRRHSGRDYLTFPDIDAPGTGDFGPREEACIDGIGELLVSTSRHHDLGVCLLHQHFPLADAEVMVEWSDPQQRLQFLQPQPMAGIQVNRITPTSFAFADAGPGLPGEVIGIEYGSVDDLPELESGLIDDERFVSQIQEVLRRHDCSARFGLYRIHNPLLQSESEGLLEVCVRDVRQLVCSVVPLSDPRFKRSIPTRWSWVEAAPEVGPLAAQGCERRYCSKSCQQFCDRPAFGRHDVRHVNYGHSGGGHYKT